MAEQTTVPPSSETLSPREMEERKCAERELQQKAHDLGERLKELQCLYTVSALLQETGLPLDEVIRRTVRSLAAAYRYPDVACARAVLDGREYRTDNFRETPWKQTADIAVNGAKLGDLEVCYLEERPLQDEGPFLKEERDLINAVAALLGRIIKERRERDALVRSEARFRRVVELVPDILYQVTLPTYRVVFISPAIETLLGFTPEEWLAGEDSWQRQLHEDDKARVRPEVDVLIEHRTDTLSTEYRMWHKDGKTLRWFADRLSVERDAYGRPVSAFGIMSDITDRKAAEKALRRREQEFRTLAENSPDIIGRFDKELRHVYVNHAIEAATGLPRATFVGKTMREVGIPEQTVLFCEEQLRHVFETGEKKTTSFVFDSPYGARRHEWHMAPEYGADGRVESVLVIARDITERVRMQEALLQQEAELREAQRVAHVGSWEWDARTDTTTWSEEFYRIAGRDPRLPAPDYYKDHAQLYSAESLARLRPAVARALQNGEPYELDLELIRPDGTTRWVVGRGEAKRDAGGRIVGLHGTVQDITERKRAEEQLRRFADQQATIARLGQEVLAKPDLSTLMDEAVQLVAENLGVEYCKILELLPDGKELLLCAGVGWKEGLVGHGTVSAGLESQAGFTLLSDQPIVVEDLRRETRFSGPPLLHDHGVVSGMSVIIRGRERPYGVMGAHTTRRRAFTADDVHFLQAVANMVAAAIERVRAEEELRRAGAYHRSLIEASLDPLVTIGPDGTITDVNAATEAVTGRGRRELIGTDFSDYFTEPAKARAGYRRVFREGRVRDYALEIRHRDGHTTPVLYNAAVYRDAAGRVVGVFAAARDITARRRMEEALRALNAELERRVAERTAQLEAAVRELEGISYTVSHDLRAPVRAVDGFAGILLEDYRKALDAEGMRLLQVIRDNTKKMGWMIDAILDFLRLGRMEIRRTGIDMDGLARTVVHELKPMVQGRTVRVKIRPMPPAHGDRAMLHQVMINLVANALKFTRPKATAHIEIGGEAGEKENTYYVKDNGVGFDMQYAGKLFGIFQRLHGMEEFEGTGVGLAIVHRIVTRHGGRAWAEGKVNEGATFYFALPATQAADRSARSGR